MVSKTNLFPSPLISTTNSHIPALDSEQGVAQPDTVLHVDANDPSNRLTKADLIDLTQRIAHGLRTHYSVGAQGPNKDVVTVMSYGQIMVPAVFFGVVAAGGIYSAASPSSTVSELARQISIGNSNLIICSAEHRDVVTAAARQCRVPLERVLVLESSPRRTLVSLGTNRNVVSAEKLAWQRITDPKALKDSVITILWSSGTTGLPKGVQLSHLNLVAETVIVNYFGRRWAAAEMEKGTFQPMEYRTLGHLPISHIAGLFGYLCMPVYNGGTVYWMRRYKWADLLKYAKEYKITAFYTVPSIFLRISKSPEVQDHFKYVEAASTGAAPMDAQLQQASNRRLGNGQDTYIGQTWGLSETTGAVTAPVKGEFDITGSISPILPNVELRIVDDDYKDVEPGQEGELLIRSPLVMNGYYNNEQATKEAFVDLKDGGGKWFCSGDIGVIRDGKFYVVDRKKVWHPRGPLVVALVLVIVCVLLCYGRFCADTIDFRNSSNSRVSKSRPQRSKTCFSRILPFQRLRSLVCQHQMTQVQTGREHMWFERIRAQVMTNRNLGRSC